MSKTTNAKSNSKLLTGASKNSSIVKVSTDRSVVVGDESASPKAKADVRKVLVAAQSGDESTLPVVRRMLANSTELVNMAGDAAALAEAAWVRRYAGSDVLTREALKVKAAELRRSLLGVSPTAVERLIVDRIVVCWLQVNFHDQVEVQQTERTLKQATFDMHRQESIQRRYLRALRTLTEIRRSGIGAFHLNQPHVGDPPHGHSIRSASSSNSTAHASTMAPAQ